MRCDYCGSPGAKQFFLDSGNQIGINFVCNKPECQKKYAEYLGHSNFAFVGGIDDYGNYTGRPQHGRYVPSGRRGILFLILKFLHLQK